MPEPTRAGRFAALAQHFEILASEPRLEILHALRTPRPLSDIRVAAGLTREGESPDRPLSRQAVTRHLDALLDAGLVKRLDRGAPTTRGDPFVINHERLFALVDDMRHLAKLRTAERESGAVAQTLAREDDAARPRVPLPRLVVAYGRDDGEAFPLAGDVGTRWRVGRAPTCEIRLDYDPYSSSENSIIERAPEGFVIRDAGGRNGTWLDWDRLPPRAARPLAGGSVIGVGRSVLVLQV